MKPISRQYYQGFTYVNSKLEVLYMWFNWTLYKPSNHTRLIQQLAESQHKYYKTVEKAKGLIARYIIIRANLARSDRPKPSHVSYFVKPMPMISKEEYEAGKDGYVYWDNINNKVIFYE